MGQRTRKCAENKRKQMRNVKKHEDTGTICGKRENFRGIKEYTKIRNKAVRKANDRGKKKI